LLRDGTEPKEVESALVAEGFDQDTATAAVLGVQANRARHAEEDEGEDWRWGRLVGGITFALGVALVIGNRTGLFPTFSYAGAILTGIGSLMLVVSWRD
jgi:hypothetical protein